MTFQNFSSRRPLSLIIPSPINYNIIMCRSRQTQKIPSDGYRQSNTGEVCVSGAKEFRISDRIDHQAMGMIFRTLILLRSSR